ncbi:MAG: OmpA family protein [Gammaproteobacteria bacterium]
MMKKQLYLQGISHAIKLFVAFVFVLLSSCSSSLWDRSPPPTPGKVGFVTGAVVGAVAVPGSPAMAAAVGAIWIGDIGHVIRSKQSLIEYLIYNGVEVIRVGDDVELVLSSDKFFHRDSANLNTQYFQVLNKIAELLRSFKKVSITVAGYTDDVGPWQRNLALSRLQALKLTQYFWTKGVDTRLMIAVGYGQERPIASNATLLGQRMNRRIEITLRQLEYEPLV